MPPVSVLIKPASSKCNLKCRYCFYHDVADKRTVADFGFMSLETLEVIIEKVLRFAEGYATFAFQGGEPTLCGLDFFRSVIELQHKHNVKSVSINNALQTNGMLIDEEWAAFLHENNFLVGLSLDGPAELHDRYRVNAGGKGTYKKVMRAAALFDEYQVAYNILFTVTETTAAHPDKLYDFFKAHDFNFLQLMPCLDPLEAERGGAEYSLTPKRFAFFLKRFFDTWAADFLGGREVSVRYFDNLVRMVMGAPPELCSLNGACQCQFVFEADGSVYPCDFYVTDEWKLGDIRERDIMELYGSDTCKTFISGSQSGTDECRTCEWAFLCRGGCRRDRESAAERTGKNYFCEAYADFLPYAYPKLIELAQYVRDYHARQRAASTS